MKQMLEQVLQQNASKIQPETETDTEGAAWPFRVVMAKSQIQSDVTYRASAFGLGSSA